MAEDSGRPVGAEPDATITPPPDAFSPHESVDVVAIVTLGSEGVSERHTFTPPAGTGAVLLSAVPLDGDEATNAELCFRFAPVETPDAVWVDAPAVQGHGPRCARCSHTVVWGIGSASALFPGTVEALDEPLPSFTVGVETRRCGLGIRAGRAAFPDLATRLRLEATWLPTPDRDAPRSLTVHLVFGAGVIIPASLDDDPFWSVALATASERFSAVGVSLEIVGPGRLDGDDDPRLVFGAETNASLHVVADQLAGASPPRPAGPHVPVAVVGCLVRTHADTTRSFPAGMTTRIPGSAHAPSFVALAAGTCTVGGSPEPPPQDPVRTGLILAHEIAHHLGLFHPRDGDVPSLMESDVISMPLHEAWFTEADAVLLRRHPALRPR